MQQKPQISEILGTIPSHHPDFDLVVRYQQLLDGLVMYSEAAYPYEVFFWDVARHGELTDNRYQLFEYMTVVEKLFGNKLPISKSNVLQAKHREFFEFEGDKLANKKPLKFYRDKYLMWNRFVGRLYTDKGALAADEIFRMRAFAKEVWTLPPNLVTVFEFDNPVVQQFLMGKTSNGNWIGVHTITVET